MPSQQKKRSNGSTRSILSDINQVLGIDDSYQAPDAVLQLMQSGDIVARDRVYYEMAGLFGCDYSKDWFFEYFQEEHADRHQNKQDFTPPCIADIIHNVLHSEPFNSSESRHITYDPAAGTGQLLIRDWYDTRRKFMPWDYKPMDHLVVCAELSVKTVPFLLFNLSVRGICGMVFHMNTMTEDIYNIYALTNRRNDPLCYSDVTNIYKR